MEDIEINLDSARTAPSTAKPSMQGVGPKNIPGKLADGDMDAASILDRFDFRRSSHPMACLFHMVFKGLALIM